MAGAMPGGPGHGPLGNPPKKPTKTNTTPGAGSGMGRDAPFGKGSGGHGTAPRSGKLSPLQKKQLFLKRKGYYHGMIDGIRGPKTNAAIAAFKAHAKAVARSKAKTRAQQKMNGTKKGPGGGGGGGHHRRGGGGGKFPPLIRPMKDAHAAVNAQYNPLINSLVAQRNQAQSQGQQNLADIGSYYDQLSNVIADRISAGNTFANSALDTQANDQQALLAALGGSANQGNASASNFMQLMHGALQGNLDAEHSYLANQQVLAGQGRAQALTNQQRLTQQQVQDINQQVNQQKAAKGSAYVSALDNARQELLQQLAARQNMQIAAGQFNLGMAQGAAQLRNMNLQNKQLAKGQGFSSLTANDKAKLVQGVNTQMYNPHTGEASLPPNQAWVKAAEHLRALGYNVQTNVKVRSWLSHSWLNYVRDYNQTHSKKYKPADNGTPFTNRQWNH